MTRSVEFVWIDSDLERGRREMGGKRLIAGKEAKGLLILVLNIEDLDGFSPSGLLLAINLSEVKESPLVRACGGRRTNAFDDAVVAMLFAVLPASRGA